MPAMSAMPGPTRPHPGRRLGQFGILDMLSHLGTQRLLALGLDSYAIACLLGLVALLKSYVGQLRSWLEEHFSQSRASHRPVPR